MHIEGNSMVMSLQVSGEYVVIRYRDNTAALFPKKRGKETAEGHSVDGLSSLLVVEQLVVVFGCANGGFILRLLDLCLVVKLWINTRRASCRSQLQMGAIPGFRLHEGGNHGPQGSVATARSTLSRQVTTTTS